MTREDVRLGCRLASARVAKNLSQYDLVIYNVGDHYDNHTYCFQHQPIVPGCDASCTTIACTMLSTTIASERDH